MRDPILRLLMMTRLGERYRPSSVVPLMYSYETSACTTPQGFLQESADINLTFLELTNTQRASLCTGQAAFGLFIATSGIQFIATSNIL